MVETYRVSEEKWRETLGNASVVFHKDRIEMGIFALKPGERSPKEGFSVHPVNEEYAYIIDGEIEFCTDKKCYPLKKGDMMYNSPGTPHYTVNNGKKIAKIIWVVSPPL